jgi:hypothetical protein
MRAVNEPKVVPSSNIYTRANRSVAPLQSADMRARIDDVIRRVTTAERRQRRAANDEKFFP